MTTPTPDPAPEKNISSSECLSSPLTLMEQAAIELLNESRLFRKAVRMLLRRNVFGGPPLTPEQRFLLWSWVWCERERMPAGMAKFAGSQMVELYVNLRQCPKSNTRI